MLNTALKNKIVNSYSEVLVDILNKTNDIENNLGLLQQSIKNFGSMQDFNVNPTILNEYKKSVKNIAKEVNNTDNIQSFLITILQRRYLFLLKEIVEKTKQKLQQKLSKKMIEVRTFSEIDNGIKKQIEKYVKDQLGEVEIVYKINKNIKEGTINFVSNSKLCEVDLQEITTKFLIVN